MRTAPPGGSPGKAPRQWGGAFCVSLDCAPAADRFMFHSDTVGGSRVLRHLAFLMPNKNENLLE